MIKVDHANPSSHRFDQELKPTFAVVIGEIQARCGMVILEPNHGTV